MGNSIYKQSADVEKDSSWGALSDGRFHYGFSSMCGWRRSNEDAHIILPCFDGKKDLALFGVLDGHGGGAVAEVCARKLPLILKSTEAYKNGDYKAALVETFRLTDEYLIVEEL